MDFHFSWTNSQFPNTYEFLEPFPRPVPAETMAYIREGINELVMVAAPWKGHNEMQ